MIVFIFKIVAELFTEFLLFKTEEVPRQGQLFFYRFFHRSIQSIILRANSPLGTSMPLIKQRPLFGAIPKGLLLWRGEIQIRFFSSKKLLNLSYNFNNAAP
jgi:hypothetical protein